MTLGYDDICSILARRFQSSKRYRIEADYRQCPLLMRYRGDVRYLRVENTEERWDFTIYGGSIPVNFGLQVGGIHAASFLVKQESLESNAHRLGVVPEDRKLGRVHAERYENLLPSRGSTRHSSRFAKGR